MLKKETIVTDITYFLKKAYSYYYLSSSSMNELGIQFKTAAIK